MQSQYEALKSLVIAIEDDVRKANAGNKAAGTRVRKAMQEIKNMAQSIRVDVIEGRDALENRGKAGGPPSPAPTQDPAAPGNEKPSP